MVTHNVFKYLVYLKERDLQRQVLVACKNGTLALLQDLRRPSLPGSRFLEDQVDPGKNKIVFFSFVNCEK